jgi:hypothetical protein
VKALFALIAILLAGCATAPLAFQPTSSQRALVNWRHDGESLTSDVVFQKGAGGAVRLVVSKGETLFTITRSGSVWTGRRAFAKNGWQGSEKSAPKPLASWICLAQNWEHAPAQKSLDVTCPRTGDRFRVLFE